MMGPQQQKRVNLLICIGIVAAILVTYEPVRHNGFVSYDDKEYITENPDIRSGITLQSLGRMFTQPHFYMWHPVTTLSHMLDCQLFGLNPFGHHLVSLLLHTINALLLFWILNSLTGTIWPSAFVAAVFALHPLQVDVVAWAAERKTVLSGLFWLITMAAYIHYTKVPRLRRYILLLLVFGLCIMTKPVVVTLPCALFLLDYWPLGRLKWPFHISGIVTVESTSKEAGQQPVSLRRLVIEKIPLFALSAFLGMMTFVAQQGGGSVIPLEHIPLSYRIGNIFLSYIRYMGKMIWPSRLAVFYPHPTSTNLPANTVLTCMLLFGLISVFSIYTYRRRRYAAVGWLWYVGTLVPVIGLVQSGGQAMANRYMYIPMLGLLIMAVWGICDLLARIRYRKIILSLSAAAVLSALGVISRHQVGYWHDDIALFKHAAEVVPDNWWAYQLLGRALVEQGRLDEAINSYKESLRIVPGSMEALNDIGYALLQQGRLDEAIALYRQMLPDIPDVNEDISATIPNITATNTLKYGKLNLIIECYSQAHLNLGAALSRKGNLDEAIRHYIEALRVKPDYAVARKNLGNAFLQKGRLDQAIEQFEKFLQMVPDSAEVHASTAYALLQKGKYNEAIMHIREVIRMQPNSAVAYYMLGDIYRQQGDVLNAVEAFNTAIELAKAGGEEELVRQIQAQRSSLESR